MISSNILTNVLTPTGQGIQRINNCTRRDILIRNKKELLPKAITVGRLISSIQASPKLSLLLGQCNTGLPFLMQLGDPLLGSILVAGDAGCGKTHQLQVMVDSAIRLNLPHDLQIALLTHHPDEWRSFWKENRSEKYLYQIKAWYDPGVEDLIGALITLAESRREGKRKGANILLFMDDFNFVDNISYEAQVNLHWLLEYGAGSGLWIAASINANYAEKFHYWINVFRTRIVGFTRSYENAAVIAAREDSFAPGLVPGSFRICTGSRWVSYHLPLLGD